jgi:hypothetical protein
MAILFLIVFWLAALVLIIAALLFGIASLHVVLVPRLRRNLGLSDLEIGLALLTLLVIAGWIVGRGSGGALVGACLWLVGFLAPQFGLDHLRGRVGLSLGPKRDDPPTDSRKS